MIREMAVCVCKGPVRTLRPTSETTDGEWLHSKPHVNNVFEYERTGWETILENGESSPTMHTLWTCAVCGMIAKLPSHSRFNPISDGPNEDIDGPGRAWWGSWDPRIYQKPTPPMVQQMPFF